MPQQATRNARTVLAITAAATLAAAPLAPGTGLGPGVQAAVVRVLAQAQHDVGHNDWAFQAPLSSGYLLAASFLALAVVWAGTGIRCRSRPLLFAALGAELVAGLLAVGGAALAQWAGSALAPDLLRLADLGSPWWCCPAALFAVATVEHHRRTALAGAGYAALLAALLLVPLPALPAVLALAALPAAAALLPERAPSDASTAHVS